MAKLFNNDDLGFKHKNQIIKSNIEVQLGLTKTMTKDAFEKAVKELDLEVYPEQFLDNFMNDLAKGAQLGKVTQDDILKAKKDVAKLIKMVVTDKNGDRRTVYVKRKEYESHTKESKEAIEATIKRQKSLLANPKSPASARKRAEEILKVEEAKLTKLYGDEPPEDPYKKAARQKVGTKSMTQRLKNFIADNKKAAKEEKKVEQAPPRINKFLDAVRTSDNSIKIDQLKVEKTDKGNWTVYHKGSKLMTVNSDLLTEADAKVYGMLKESNLKKEVKPSSDSAKEKARAHSIEASDESNNMQNGATADHHKNAAELHRRAAISQRESGGEYSEGMAKHHDYMVKVHENRAAKLEARQRDKSKDDDEKADLEKYKKNIKNKLQNLEREFLDEEQESINGIMEEFYTGGSEDEENNAVREIKVLHGSWKEGNEKYAKKYDSKSKASKTNFGVDLSKVQEVLDNSKYKHEYSIEGNNIYSERGDQAIAEFLTKKFGKELVMNRDRGHKIELLSRSSSPNGGKMGPSTKSLAKTEVKTPVGNAQTAKPKASSNSKKVGWDDITDKDRTRVQGIIDRANGDRQKEEHLAAQMANAIQDPVKAQLRGMAAEDENYHNVAEIFFNRAKGLGYKK